jgi:hypothetical protein
MNYFRLSLCNLVAYVFSKLRAKGYEGKFAVFVSEIYFQHEHK